jgi:cell division septation protein DedD
MNSFTAILTAGALAAALTMVGCSSSEEAAKSSEVPSGPSMTRTDTNVPTVPETPTPPESKKTELPTTEKNVPPEQVKTQTTPPVTQEQVPETQTPQTTQTPQKTGMMMWSVQIGAFKQEAGAVKTLNEAKVKFNQPVYKDYDAVTMFYKVTVGSFQTREQASQFKEEVRSKGYAEAFVVEVRR